jgi:cellulose synthase/poly-beta-1,6-N-acetylglucosamine synthase-like glycosyltransferase
VEHLRSPVAVAPDRRRTVAPAASSPIAVAARAFGDDYPAVRQRWIRAAGLFFVASAVVYLPWLVTSLNDALPWLIWPFLVANLFTLTNVLLSIVNSWWRTAPQPQLLPVGGEPIVGVIVPTCGEPIPMVLRTIVSVLEQDWPSDRLVIVVSDDGHDPDLEAALTDYPVLYYSPPSRSAPGRDGAAKAGNLNAALGFLDEQYPDLAYVETRDADDELASRRFLRHAVGQLETDQRLAYVQTIKEAQVSAGDPFNNREAIFYRGQMLARNAANAVFPCGSGLVWRRAALRDIGDFPTWNLVEDIQSGVEALCRGWRGVYLPIVGAVPQHSPEDVPNFYKQRGTWCLDTVRLIVWRGLRGLTIRQKGHFLELLLFYLSSFTVLIYLPAIAASLLGYVPIESSTGSFLAHMLPIVIATEAWLLALNYPYNDRRRRQRHLYRDLWRVRTMWAGLAPVFMKASIQAVVNGPDHKPSYKVTRKHDDLRWHWRDTLPQATIVLAVIVTLIYALRFGTLPSPVLLVGTVYWGGLNVILLGNFVTRGWHGLAVTRSLFRRAPAPADSTP